MKLTTKGRYAVAAMADIAACGGKTPVALADVSLRQGISVAYLEQLFAKLRRAGLVESARGAAGGYSLAREPNAIRVADVVAAVDEEIKTTACETGSAIGCRGTSARCMTHDLWDELGRQIGIFLNAVTLEDVVERRVLGMASVNAPSRRPSFETPIPLHPEEDPRAQTRADQDSTAFAVGSVSKGEGEWAPQDEEMKAGAAE